ncbi:DUF5133 domain-containing protein [Streptacidiphilus sp. P02-A3a]|uniref:DUF5133 domain-containing protein n=1 Tax=Streptacidiphilus sp. P02-A3a TaxID=2704468 RepID=UPI0015FA6BD3|nr:DUF5133 domain-containing protein [Streptacidiphilus sp. P02-A3a]QMU70728.1 DUF5133 domain-containing protein [Streptacidiphilus sp. P02-A3a]
MPLINLALLQRLVTELDLLDDGPQTAARREDLYYTLCVSTGLRQPEQALSRARRLLADRAQPSTPMVIA